MTDMHLYALPALFRSGQGPLLPWVRATVRSVVMLLAILVALFSYRYLFDLPPVPPTIAGNGARRPWLAIHAGFAATALLIGGLQFSGAVRRRWPGAHRAVGRTYALCCLLGAGAGLVLATGARAGPVAGMGFGALAVVWALATGLGWHHARHRRFAAHRRWMIRSWALTLSAVTLRLYLPAAELMGLPEMPAYRAIAFLCWIPNLLAAEVMLRYGAGPARARSSRPDAAAG